MSRQAEGIKTENNHFSIQCPVWLHCMDYTLLLDMSVDPIPRYDSSCYNQRRKGYNILILDYDSSH